MRHISFFLLTALATSTIMTSFAHARHNKHSHNTQSSSSSSATETNAPPPQDHQNNPNASESTNKYDITILFKGKPEIIQQAKDRHRSIGRGAAGIIDPTNHLVDLGDPASSYVKGKVKTFEIPNDTAMVVIPAGSITTQDMDFPEVDENGRAKKNPTTSKIIMQRGSGMNMSFSVIGAGMPNQSAGADLTEVIISATSPTDVQYFYKKTSEK